MSLTVRKNGGLPSLLTDFLRPVPFFGRDLFDFDSDLVPAQLGVNVPSVNIKETPKEFNLELAAPGLERKDFEIEVNNNILTISAEKEVEKKEGDKEYSRREYSYSSFCRSFTLPEFVKEDDIKAKYENGILKVAIPKMKESATKAAHKISVS